MTIEIRVVCADILDAQTDIIALKYADAFHGADLEVARQIEYSNHLEKGMHIFVKGPNVAAKEILFVGVGPLSRFKYKEMARFGKFILETVSKERPRATSVALTIHGPGYGLDERELFLSLVGGLQEGRIHDQSRLTLISIVEMSAKRAARLNQLLQRTKASDVAQHEPPSSPKLSKEYGAKSETKQRLFVAMPFAEKYLDEYEIAFTEAAHRSGLLCERLDFESFIGDIFAEIKRRIIDASGVIALLNDHNPNVFLEIGFAIAHDKPIIFVVKKETKVPFDIRGQRYIEYSRIGELRDALASEISKLLHQGIFSKRSKGVLTE